MVNKILLGALLLLAPFQEPEAFNGDINKLISSLPRGTLVSIAICEAGKNEYLYERNSTLDLKPASNMKVLTTGLSLIYLGHDYKISTCLYYNKDKIINGILDGNLYIKGYGNTLFKHSDMDSLINLLKKKGINLIKGNIVYDNSFFKKSASTKKISYTKEPLDIPTVSPITINNNIIEISIKERDNKLFIETYPASKFITVENNIGLSESRNNLNAILTETIQGFHITLYGNISQNSEQKIYLYCANPEILFSLLLKEKLEDSGITINGLIRPGVVPGDVKTEISSSVTLPKFIAETNKNSNNFFAANLKNILEMNLLLKGKKGNPFSIKSLLKFEGADIEKLTYADGSGISNRNRISAKSLVQILNKLYNNTTIFNDFYSSLSIAGVDGTLQERFNEFPLVNNFHGKTGYMNGVSSISGYLTSRSGKHLIISVITNFKQKDIEYYRDFEKKILEWAYYKY